MLKPLTKQEIAYIMQDHDKDTKIKVFCIDGIIVEIPLIEALQRLPYDIMTKKNQHIMDTVIGDRSQLLSPMTSAMLIADVPTGKIVENINEQTLRSVRDLLS